MRSKWLWAALALVAVLGITTAASATTRGLITGKQIAPHTINSKHLVNHAIQAHDLSNGLIRSLHGARGALGPAGPQGPVGPQGATGAQGPVGPSNAYETTFVSGAFDPYYTTDPYEITESDLATAPYIVTSNSLPFGSYTVTGQVTIVAAAAATSYWRVLCQLRVPLSGHGWVGAATAAVGDQPGYATEVTLPIFFTAQLTSVSSMGLSCIRTDGDGENHGENPSVTYSDFIATRVGTVHR